MPYCLGGYLVLGVPSSPHVVAIDGLTSGHGTLFHHNNITQLQLAAIFVGQKKNEINRVTLISQHSNEVFENEKQLVNIDFKHIFSFSRYK